MLELLVVACLLVAVAGLWLRIERLHSQVRLLQSQIASHQRGQGEPANALHLAVQPPVVFSRPDAPPPSKPALRLVKS
jgi:hypothetical protein